MARFLGRVQGSRGPAQRLGDKGRGLTTTAASWSGAISTRLYVDGEDRDCAEVTVHQWRGAGPFKVLYDGPIEDAGR